MTKKHLVMRNKSVITRAISIRIRDFQNLHFSAKGMVNQYTLGRVRTKTIATSFIKIKCHVSL